MNPAQSLLLSNYHRRLKLSSAHEAKLRKLGSDLVESNGKEVHVHDLNNRTKTGKRSADACTHNRNLGDGGITYSFGAEFVKQSPRDLVSTAEDSNFLPHQKDVRISYQLLAKSISYGVAV